MIPPQPKKTVFWWREGTRGPFAPVQILHLTDRDLRHLDHTQVFRGNPAGRKSHLLPRHESAGYVERRQAAFWEPHLFPDCMRSGLSVENLWKHRRILIGVYLYPDELPFVMQYGTSEAKRLVARCLMWAAFEFRRTDRALLALQCPMELRAFDRGKLMRFIAESADCTTIAGALRLAEVHEVRPLARRAIKLNDPEGAVQVLRAAPGLALRHRRKLIDVVRKKACPECIALALTYVKLPGDAACELAEKLKGDHMPLVRQVLDLVPSLDSGAREILARVS